jgi:hypothetical protein
MRCCESHARTPQPYAGVATVTVRWNRQFGPPRALGCHVRQAATTESTLRFLDVRASSMAQEWQPSSGAHGALRAVAVDESNSWIAVGCVGRPLFVCALPFFCVYLCIICSYRRASVFFSIYRKCFENTGVWLPHVHAFVKGGCQKRHWGSLEWETNRHNVW